MHQEQATGENVRKKMKKYAPAPYVYNNTSDFIVLFSHV